MKRQIILQFLSLNSLKAFQEKISLTFFEISATKKLLHCACTEAEIALAKTKFSAVLVDKNDVRQSSIS